ncbi:MAG: TOBE domain-containing protein, partial [Gammaproteobacteria bacterium]
EKALVARSAGGARGGGTRLTDYGEKLLQGLQNLQAEQQALAARLGRESAGLDEVAQFFRGQVSSSARNQFYGRVKRIRPGAVNSEVSIGLSGSNELIAVVTNDSLKTLALKKGGGVIALVKASWIILSTNRNIASSARNQLRGSVSKVNRGPVNCEVILDLGDDKSLCAVITRQSLNSLGLKQGVKVTALFKASSVILLAA